MPTVYNIRASNNATFQWTRDLSQFAGVYNLSAATIRMQARLSPYAPDPPAYQWVTGATTGGQIAFNATTNLCVFSAPESDMAALSGDIVYDCRLEFAGGESIIVFGGLLRVSEGITRMPADLVDTGVYNIRASSNATFQWTRDLSAFAAVENLATAVMRMQARTTPYAPDPPAYEWCSANTSGGVIAYDSTTHLATVTASESDMAALSALGDLVYDFRLEWTDGTDVILFGGALRWRPGVTREPTGPIVPVNDQLLTLTQAVALVEAGGGSGLTPSVLAAALVTLIQSLPTSPTSAGPRLWNNGGSPQYS